MAAISVANRAENIFSGIGLVQTKDIVNRLADKTLVESESDLEVVANTFVHFALEAPEQQLQAYAEIAESMNKLYTNGSRPEGEVVLCFRRSLLHSCQDRFPSLVSTFEPTDEDRSKYQGDVLAKRIQQRKSRALAFSRFIATLCTRSLVPIKVLGTIVMELVGHCYRPSPEEHNIACVSHMIRIVGPFLDKSRMGTQLLDCISERLQQLVRRKADISDALSDDIANLVKLRSQCWPTLVVTLREECGDDDSTVVRGRKMSGNECFSAKGSLSELNTAAVVSHIVAKTGVPSALVKLVLPSGRVL